ncbi:alpha/beta fold hydrolase [Aliiglaciecola litoralis]|uniref:Alpha/beta fold hydrolase n=1 Tax=Aliiglaciecola litoralis TaxID=582857 RepID=A0ABN1LPP4_9ALTE
MLAVNEQKSTDQTCDDDLLALRYEQHIVPFWKNNVANGYFSGKGNVQIAYAYAIHPNPIGSIAISSGRIETLLKYKELVFNLFHAGYSVFIHDHRGQGLSGRLTPNSHQGYVDNFNDYVTDFKLFFDKVITPNSQHQPILLSHSMGAAIASLYLLAHPDDFAKCIMSAPMFGIRPALPNWLARIITWMLLVANKVTGSLPWYFLGQGNYLAKPFETNELTSSEARYRLFRSEYTQHPECQLGGVTTKWLAAALAAMRTIDKHAHTITTPILLLQAQNDTVVNNHRQNKVAAKLPNCKMVYLAKAKHELFMEQDEIRDKCLREILAFLS